MSKKFLYIIITFLLLSLSSNLFAQSTPYAKNGIAYVLYGVGFDADKRGVWRFNDKNADNLYPIVASAISPWKVFTSIEGAKGLSVNQQKKINAFLLEPNGTVGDWATCTPGIVPNIVFKDDCPFWVTVVTPSDMSGTWTRVYGSGPAKFTGDYSKALSAHGWGFWKENSSGKTYNSLPFTYWVQFGPNSDGVNDGVKYFWGVPGAVPAGKAKGPNNGNRGTPIWNGSDSVGKKHEDFDNDGTFGYRKLILPSHFGAVARYLYATTYGASKGYAAGTEMNESVTDTLTYADANKMGNFGWNATGIGPTNVGNNDSSTHHNSGTDQFYGAVIKLIYRERSRDLVMRIGTDSTNLNTWPGARTQNAGMGSVGGTMLQIKDYDAMRYYGKWCGDGCIPGGGATFESTGGVFSDIQVLTTTKGKAYGFNPEGRATPTSTSDTGAMLRRVDFGGSGGVALDIAGFSKFANATTLSGKGEVNKLKSIGVSSNFSDATGDDFIYGSFEPYFAVQDSWWGKGGIGYEVSESGEVTKYNFVNNK